MRNKDKKKLMYVGLFSIGILLVLGVIIFAMSKIEQHSYTTGAVEYIESPVFGYYECSAAGKSIKSNPVTIYNTQGTYDVLRCSPYTEECTFSIIGESTSILGRRVAYRICPSYDTSTNMCDLERYLGAGDVPWFSDGGVNRINIPGTYTYQNKILVKYQECLGISYGTTCAGVWKEKGSVAKWYQTYTPFILWYTSPLTGRHEYTSLIEGCKFPASDTYANGYLMPGVDKLINALTDVKGQSLTQTSTSLTELEPHKTRNVIEAFIPLNVNNVQFVTYNGQQGYCLNRNIYKIATVTTKTGTSKIVDTTYNNIIAGPSNGIECCPQDKEPTRKCSTDYKWHPIDNAECSYYNPCQGVDWYPGGPKTLIKYNCISGKCVKDSKVVECTNNDDCIGNPNGGVCDTLLWKCSSITPPLPNGTCPDFCKKDLDCFNCGDNFKCSGAGWFSDGVCKKTDNNGKLPCESCTKWAMNIFKSDADKCEAQSIIRTTYNGFWDYINPLNWIKSGIDITGITNMNIMCPIFFLIVGILLFILFLITMIAILLITGSALLVKKLFSRSSNKRKK